MIGTIATGELPLIPELTPGWGVAGAILIVTGASYALIGIRTRWVHCFFSVAFLAAVGVAVLIVYVMSPPIKNAIQGAYVVAVVCTGVVLGGAGLIFRDILECLGCLLGGFCLSMWLLTLKAGGLTGSGGAGTVIFICVFSGAGFAGYFSRWTRPQYMMACIALNGATATVLGIDCFSRAGLKEFWAWIWDLNDNLFPYDADTYPLTRGIRVEQAVTIILMLGGIVSQSQLWNVIKERRARREEERRKGQEAIDSADMKAGDDIERINAHERRQWEAVHGDPKSPVSEHTAYDSGVGDVDSEKKRRHSGTATTVTRPSVTDDMDEIEMAELPADMPTHVVGKSGEELRPEVPPKTKAASEMVMGKSEKEGMVTVRVAVDEVDAVAADEPRGDVQGQNKASTVGRLSEPHLSLKPSTQPRRTVPSTPVPEVVPLPFKVPQFETDEYEDGNRSSFATFADLEDELPARRSVDSKRSSFAKRLSAGSADLFKRLSHNSLAKQLEAARGPSESQEELALPVRGDRDSVAATFDEESSLGEDDARSRFSERPFSTEVKAELGEKPADGVDVVSEAVAEGDAADPAVSSEKGKQKAENDDDSKQGKSVASEADSKAASLTKDRLPRALSKVALSYRTNEWAKHLSHAEIPSPEELQILEPVQPHVADVNEAAVPVNVNELQKTAENAAPPPAMPRTVSAMSVRQSKIQSRVSSAQRLAANLAVPASELAARSPSLGSTSPNPEASGSQNYLSATQPSSKRSSARTVGAITEEEDYESRMSSESRQAAVRAAAAALTGEATPGMSPSSDNNNNSTSSFQSRPPVPGVVSYDSPQTLIGKRDMLLRAKNQALNRPESNLRGSAVVVGAGLDDDLPLNQRKALMMKSDPRRNSMSSMNSNRAYSGDNNGSSRRSSFGYAQRRSDLPSQVARESQIINQQQQQQQQQLYPYTATGAVAHGGMRQSSSSSFFPQQAQAAANTAAGGAGGPGPLINQVYGIPGTTPSKSKPNSFIPSHQATPSRDAETVRRDIDEQRQYLLAQKEAEARQRESVRLRRESHGRRVERRMRTDSQMLEAHREAMRKMQRGVGS